MNREQILKFIIPQNSTKVFHNSKLLFEFPSSESKEYIFTVNKTALLIFRNNER